MPMDIWVYNPFTVIAFKAKGWIQAFSTAFLKYYCTMCFFFSTLPSTVCVRLYQSWYNCMAVWPLIDLTFPWPSNVSPIHFTYWYSVTYSTVNKVLCRIGWIKTGGTNWHNKTTLQKSIHLLYQLPPALGDIVRRGFANAKSSVMVAFLDMMGVIHLTNLRLGASPFLLSFPSSPWLLPSHVWL